MILHICGQIHEIHIVSLGHDQTNKSVDVPSMSSRGAGVPSTATVDEAADVPWRDCLGSGLPGINTSDIRATINMCHYRDITGWWFGCHQFYFPIYWVSNHPN